MPVRFPPLEAADRHGILAIGGQLTADTLVEAYKSGIFPWPFDEESLAWFSPPKRAVLFFDNLHLPRSLVREIRKSDLSFCLDCDFDQIIENCALASNRTGQSGTWITSDMITAYVELHRLGIAHCVGAYRSGKLVGGIYGIGIGMMFAGESMYYTEPNASKLALLVLIDYLRSNGVTWLDCQVMTPHMKSLGACDITRDDFVNLLNSALNGGKVIYPPATKLTLKLPFE